MKRLLKRLHGRQTGFTLIELLVVIAIIGILAAIIVPNVSKYMGSGQTAANQAELKLVQNAVAAAMADAKSPGWANNTDLDITISGSTVSSSANPTITGHDNAAHAVGDYFSGGSLADLIRSYAIDAQGVVTAN